MTELDKCNAELKRLQELTHQVGKLADEARELVSKPGPLWSPKEAEVKQK